MPLWLRVHCIGMVDPVVVFCLTAAGVKIFEKGVGGENKGFVFASGIGDTVRFRVTFFFLVFSRRLDF